MIEVASPVTCRLMREQDRAVVSAMMEEKSFALGTSLWLPELGDPKVEAVFMFERDGIAAGALIFRQVSECIFAGNQPEVLRGALAHQERIRALLAHVGVDNVVAWVPEALLSSQRRTGMERIMNRIGFERIGPEFVSFETEVLHGAE